MEKNLPWNDINAPVEQNGEKIFFSVLVIAFVLFYGAMLVAAAVV